MCSLNDRADCSIRIDDISILVGVHQPASYAKLGFRLAEEALQRLQLESFGAASPQLEQVFCGGGGIIQRDDKRFHRELSSYPANGKKDTANILYSRRPLRQRQRRAFFTLDTPLRTATSATPPPSLTLVQYLLATKIAL